MRGPEENVLSIMEIKYSNVVANTLIEEYDSIFNDPRMNHPQQPYPDSSQLNRCRPINHVINHDDSFGLGLPNQQYHNLPSSAPTINTGHPNKPFKFQNGSNDLAQFALKSYDHTSRQAPFISNSIAPMDIRPINDMKTYSFDQALIVPAEQAYQHLGGSMNNSMNYLGYLDNHPSHTNSLNYSSGSLTCGPLGERYNSPNPMNSFPYYALNTNKVPYRSNKVVTLYACVGDTESELSFGPNEIINDGKLEWLPMNMI